jgi:hypothetical protein
MAPEDKSANLIWLYLFDGLTPEEKTDFEEKMAADPELMKEVEEARKLDATLMDIGSAGEPKSDDELAEELSENLHKDYVQAEKDGTLPQWVLDGTPVPKPPLIWQQRMPMWGGIAAIAAVLLILANVFVMPHGPVQWQRADYGEWPPPNRTEGEPVPARVYAEQDLKDVAAQMSVAVMDAYRVALGMEAGDEFEKLKRRWKLRVRFQELKDGDLSVRVAGQSLVEPKGSREWELFVSSRAELDRELSGFAVRVGSAMVVDTIPTDEKPVQ